MVRDIGTYLDQERPFTTDKIVKLISRVAAALGKLHSTNQFWDHRERSIVVDSDLTVRIDGDIANRKAVIPSGEVDIERDFLPPECVGTDIHDSRSDIFALGLLAYEAITGKGPYSGKTVLETMTQIKRPEITPPHEISPECDLALSAVVMNMLCSRPEDRFQNTSELISKLEQIV